MRIITNPFFGAGKKARDIYFLNQDISVFLTTASFSQKLKANNIIYVRTNFGQKMWDNSILVKNNSKEECFGRPLFLYKHTRGGLKKDPKGKYVVRVRVVKHIVVTAEKLVDGEIVDKIGDLSINPKRGLVFFDKDDHDNYFNMLKEMIFVPDIVIDNPCGKKSHHLNEKERKMLDAFYTPNELADIMANQLIGKGPVFDPFCGKGSLLEACVRNGKAKEKDLYGWDIDPVAIEFCRRKFPQGHFEVKNSLNL